jgi:hypothetical protein
VPYQNPNQMLVEDEDLRGVVIGIMRHPLGGWSKKESDWPTYIAIGNSADEVLNENGLVASLQESGVKTLGIIVDANNSFKARWERIRDFARANGGNPPNTCPEGGLIVDNVLSRRFGAWIMPDNKSAGMVENFCHALVPPGSDKLWKFAFTCVTEAKRQGAPFKNVHTDKAHIHTWLAWQDQPGERMGTAITRKILKPDADKANPFVAWFRKLYGV